MHRLTTLGAQLVHRVPQQHAGLVVPHRMAKSMPAEVRHDVLHVHQKRRVLRRRRRQQWHLRFRLRFHRCCGCITCPSASAEAQHQVERRLLADVGILQGASVIQLPAGEDQTLLIWRYAFLVLDLNLDVIDGRIGPHVQGDRLAG